MKLKLFLIAASAMALASCSSDEVVKNNEDANAIQFSVVANNGSRAADYWCNNSKPNQFNVWAAVEGDTYFANESFSLQSGTYKIDGGTLRYWPDALTNVSFYAAKVKADGGSTDFATVTWKPAGGSTIFMDMTGKESASKQNDLLYAYEVAQRPTGQNDVALNFRHALSQIVFYAQNLNKNIYVTIDEVEIHNINSKGVFTFPSEETSTPVSDHTNQADLDALSTSVGTWNTDDEDNKLGQGVAQVLFHPTTDKLTTAVAVAQGGASQNDPVSITDNKDTDGSDRAFAHSLLLIPQHVDAWDHNTTPKPTEATSGAYFVVKCTIQNVAAGDGSSNGDVYLWGASGATKEIYLPVEIDWATGKKYIYTFKFLADGHGGYDGEGKDVLFPVEFKITVDDFVDQEKIPVNDK